MKILDFLKHRNSKDKKVRSYAEIRAEVESHAVPALMLLRTNGGATKSYLGGDPYLPAGVSWPSKDGNDLTFLASLDLEEIAGTNVISWLPDRGKLLFFYDEENQPWGFEPEDRGGWSVIYVDQLGTEESAKEETLPQYFVELTTINSLPDMERFDDVGIVLNDAEQDRWFDGSEEESYEGHVYHQVGGYPRPVQGDQMELEAQLASNGNYLGDGTGYQSEEGQRLAPGKKDWRLLLQFDSDDDLEVMWGDSGSLYFWVREQDAIQGDFSGVWLVLQCS